MTRLTALAPSTPPTQITLGTKIHAGGAAGSIHTIDGQPNLLAKLYHDSAMARQNRAKIEAMLAKPPQLAQLRDNAGALFAQIAWPTALLCDGAGEMVGFVMPRLDTNKAVLLEHLLGAVGRKRHGLSDAQHLRVFAALNLASIFTEVHRQGHHMVDIKPINLFVHRTDMFMSVIDTDGFSVAGPQGQRFAASHISDDYAAPEAIGKAADQLGEPQDRFALAVILFQLLNGGLHPFQGKLVNAQTSALTLQERIGRGLYPYGQTPHPQMHPHPRSLHGFFPDTTRALFDRAFGTPALNRPSAKEWRNHLQGLNDAGLVRQCPVEPGLHVDFGKGCGLCAQNGRTVFAPVPKPAQPAGRVNKSRRLLWPLLAAGGVMLLALVPAGPPTEPISSFAAAPPADPPPPATNPPPAASALRLHNQYQGTFHWQGGGAENALLLQFDRMVADGQAVAAHGTLHYRTNDGRSRSTPVLVTMDSSTGVLVVRQVAADGQWQTVYTGQLHAQSGALQLEWRGGGTPGRASLTPKPD